MQHREHGVGKLARLRGRSIGFEHASDELLEVEGVAVGSLDDSSDDGVGHVGSERCAREPFGRAPRESPEPNLLEVRVAEKLGKEIVDFGAREGEHHEPALRERGERATDVGDAGRIAPMQILEDEQNHASLALRPEPALERPTEPVAHHARIEPRRSQFLARRAARRSVDEKRDEGARRISFGDSELHESRGEPGGARFLSIALANAERIAHELADEAERRAGRHRIASRRENARAFPRSNARRKLVTQTALPRSGGRRHENGAGHVLGLAFGEGRFEKRELLFTTDARRALSEQRSPTRIGECAVEDARRALTANVEPGIEKAGRDIVDERPRWLLFSFSEQRSRAIDGGAHREAPGRFGATRRHDEARGRACRLERERT